MLPVRHRMTGPTRPGSELSRAFGPVCGAIPACRVPGYRPRTTCDAVYSLIWATAKPKSACSAWVHGSQGRSGGLMRRGRAGARGSSSRERIHAIHACVPRPLRSKGWGSGFPDDRRSPALFFRRRMVELAGHSRADARPPRGADATDAVDHIEGGVIRREVLDRRCRWCCGAWLGRGVRFGGRVPC